MKMTKREFIEQLDKYPDDYEMDLSYYFMADPSSDEEESRYFQSLFEVPIIGTAADKDSKVIKFVLNRSNEKTLKRISDGYDPIIIGIDDKKSDDS